MGVHLRMMNESFFSIHGVPESINISKKPLCQNFHLFSSFKIFSNFMPYSRDVRSTLHGLLYTKPNLSLWGFTMPKGFGIGQHIREIPGTLNFTRTFGHTVLANIISKKLTFTLKKPSTRDFLPTCMCPTFLYKNQKKQHSHGG